jgi:hypothetical protein
MMSDALYCDEQSDSWLEVGSDHFTLSADTMGKEPDSLSPDDNREGILLKAPETPPPVWDLQETEVRVPVLQRASRSGARPVDRYQF